MSVRSVLLAGLAVLALAGCAAGSEAPTDTAGASAPPSSVAPSPSSAAAATISIAGFAFDPPTLEVEPGATVVWTNAEDAFHTVTAGTPDAPSGLFDSGEFDTGETFSFTFDEAGTYPFFCARHDFMQGEVVVGP